ncbi:MAG: cadherin-like domain-containing protein, partial [Candidatus Omnitrophica bacterium]|nr:cadherin-like domain-containing protein [Candidatus Omnitrophota bacterium]
MRSAIMNLVQRAGWGSFFFLVMSAVLPAVAQADISSGLAGYWPFDDGAGATVTDASGNAKPGITNYGTTWTPGKIGAGALLFDGIDEGQNVAIANFAGLNTFSYSLWINHSAAIGDNGQYIISTDVGGTNPCYSLSTLKAGNIVFAGQSGGKITAPADLLSAGWMHIVATQDAVNNVSQLYLNNSLVGTSTALACTQNFNNRLVIGEHPWHPGDSDWSGLIDDVRVYNRVITAAEVDTLYGQGSATNTNPPIVMNNTSGAILAFSSDATISVTTDVPAVCRYATSSGVSYGAMPYTLTTTDNRVHSSNISVATGTNNFYVRCQNSTGGAVNTSDFKVAILKHKNCTNASDTDHFVAVNGQATNCGTINDPWTLTYAAAGAQGRVKPGDMVWLRGGTYTAEGWSGVMSFSVSGASKDALVTFRNYNRERATFDARGVPGSFSLAGKYLRFWGLEVMDSSRASVVTDPYNVFWSGHDTISYINMISHDGGIGLGIGGEAYGNIIYNAGKTTREHCLYWQNDYTISGLIKLIKDNIFFNASGTNFLVYGSSGSLKGFIFDGNTSIRGTDADYFIGGGTPVENALFSNNYSYGRTGIVLGYGDTDNVSVNVSDNYFAATIPIKYSKRFNAMTVSNNIFAGTSGYDVSIDEYPLRIFTQGPYDIDHNAYYYKGGSKPFYYKGGSAAPSAETGTLLQWRKDTVIYESDGTTVKYAGLDLHSVASTSIPPDKVFIQPNDYEAGRANITIYNWTHASAVPVDVTGILSVGDHYELRNAMNYYGDVLTGDYYGGTLSVPMTGRTIAVPLDGSAAAVTTYPEFGAFVLINTSRPANLPPPGALAVAAVNAAAVPPAAMYTLTVNKAGLGVVSGGSIECGAVCTAEVARSGVVTLQAVPDDGSEFAGWFGDCSGLKSCTVTLSEDRSVTAMFVASPVIALAFAAAAPEAVVPEPAAPEPVLPDFTQGLAAWWQFDETSGTAAYDASGNEITATTGATRATYIGGALDFQVSNYSKATAMMNDDRLNLSTGATISAWVYTNTTGKSQRIFGYHAYSFAITPENYLQAVWSTNSSYVSQITTTKLDVNKWYHIAATFDGNSSKIFVNGVLAAMLPLTPSAQTIRTAPPGKYFYASGEGSDQHLFGMMDELRIHKRALSTDEIQSLYASDLARVEKDPPVRSAGYPRLMPGAKNTDIPVLSSGIIKTTISLTTNESSACKYDTNANTAYANMPNTFQNTGALTHYQQVSGLIPGTTYQYFVKCRDTLGNANSINSDFTISFMVRPGNPAPVIAKAGQQWYVAPGIVNLPGDITAGTIGNPFDIVTGLNSSRILPGDTVWLREGTYLGPISFNFNGTQAAPIIVRNYDQERVVIDANFQSDMNGSTYVWIWGLEFIDSTKAYTNEEIYGVLANGGIGSKVINSVFHDIGIGPQVAEAYGNILYNIGRNVREHGFYWQNNYPVSGYIKRILDNIVSGTSGYSVHIFGTNGNLDGFEINGNTLFNSNQSEIIIGGGNPVNNVTVLNNHTYGLTSAGIRLGQGADGNTNTSLINNYFAEGGGLYLKRSFKAITLTNNVFIAKASFPLSLEVSAPWGDPHRIFTDGPYEVDHNEYYDASYNKSVFYSNPDSIHSVFADWHRDTAFDQHSDEYLFPVKPSNKVFIQRNRYEAGRANITIYNWSRLASVNIDRSDNITNSGCGINGFIPSEFSVSMPVTGLINELRASNISLPAGIDDLDVLNKLLQREGLRHSFPGLVLPPEAVDLIEGEFSFYPDEFTPAMLSSALLVPLQVPVPMPLTVFKTGAGTGTITSAPAGINCGSTCYASIQKGDTVTLTATPVPGSTFAGWTGKGCSGTGVCTLKMDEARAVAAAFVLPGVVPSSWVPQLPTGADNITALNNVLMSRGLAGQFPNLQLSPEAEALRDRLNSLSMKEVMKLNRLVLEAAYPQTCPKNKTVHESILTRNELIQLNRLVLEAKYPKQCPKSMGPNKIDPETELLGCVQNEFWMPEAERISIGDLLKPGDTYELRNAQDYFGDVITGTYNGGPITVPMTGRTVAKPVMGTAQASTFPEFGAFVLIKTSVAANAPPMVTLSASKSSYTTAETVNLTAAASDLDGTIVKVEFFNGATLIGTRTAAPFTHNWTNVPAGLYRLTVKATDNYGNSTRSNAMIITVVPAMYDLVVTKFGNGAGTVISDSIVCGETCTASKADRSEVTLVAIPSQGSIFAGWSGSGCAGTGGCRLTMGGAKTVSAEFALIPVSVPVPVMVDLTVTKLGSGEGTITSVPVGIDCGTTCTASIIKGNAVTMTAAPVLGSNFAGWTGGGCSGTGVCSVTMDTAKNILGEFVLIPVNRDPQAISQSVSVVEDTTKAITLTGSDVDGDVLTYSIVMQPIHGTLSGTAPNVTYTPAVNYSGADAFSFKVNDGTVSSAAAAVAITVTAANDAPVGLGQTVSVVEDTAKAITLAGSDDDGDVLTYAIVMPPTHGTLSGTAPNVTYTPAVNYTGADA